MTAYLKRHLMRPKLFRWVSDVDANGYPAPRRVEYVNTAEDVDTCLHWLGRAAEHDTGNYDDGGRRAQCHKATLCAGIVSHEVAVMIAKSQADAKKDRGS
jgi:hypothetical protein